MEAPNASHTCAVALQGGRGVAWNAAHGQHRESYTRSLSEHVEAESVTGIAIKQEPGASCGENLQQIMK